MTQAEAIAKAHQAIAGAAARAAACPWRPNYHFAAPAGWVNDPNGFIHFRGEYHLFYQHYPYEPRWGPMHWGHATSTDLLRWKHLPIALAPTEVYETSKEGCGCWSGSAVRRDGELVVIYTGHAPGRTPVETQNIAMSADGVTFEKHPSNPVIRELPPGASADFRDPKAWQHDGRFYVVVGTSVNGKGAVALYRSPDMVKWEFLGYPAQSDGTLGKMWECPDLFELDGKHVLIFSPMGFDRPLSMYAIGQLDYTSHKFTIESTGLIDHGPDFYAPQTCSDTLGRRVMIAWMQAWGSKVPTDVNGWSVAMTLARELRIVNGRLVQRPIEDMETLKSVATSVPGGRLTGTKQLSERLVAGKLQLHMRGSGGRAGLRFRMSADRKQYTELAWCPGEEKLMLNRDHAGQGSGGQYSAALAGSELELNIYLDRSSVEVFSADGSVALTSRMFPDRSSTSLELFTEGNDVEVVSCTVLEVSGE